MARTSGRRFRSRPRECSATCVHVNACGTEDLWRRLDNSIRSVLGGTTLEDLIREAQVQGEALKLREHVTAGGQALPMIGSD